jgi:hypothetical protein
MLWTWSPSLRMKVLRRGRGSRMVKPSSRGTAEVAFTNWYYLSGQVKQDDFSEHVSCMKEMRSVGQILVRNLEGRDGELTRCGWEDKIKFSQKLWCCWLDWINSGQDTRAGQCEENNGLSCSINKGKYYDKTTDYYLWNIEYAVWRKSVTENKRLYTETYIHLPSPFLR